MIRKHAIYICGVDGPIDMHVPNWSFVANKSCAKAEHEARRGYGYNPCPEQCLDCAAICEQNDYVRGMLPPRYSVPVSCHSTTHVYVHWYDHIVSCLWWNYEAGA